MSEILVLGGTGKVGRRIVQRLRAAGRPVRAASRGGDVPFDLGDPATWPRALDGVAAAYLVEPDASPDIDRAARVPALVERAAAAGVRRFVLLTAADVDGRADHLHAAARDALRASGAEWTHLRPDWFAQNFSESFLLDAVRAGTVALPAGDGRTAFVDADDIADVAVAALTEDGHDGRTYTLTGPRSLSFGEAAELIGKAAGRPVRYVHVEPDAYTARQIEHGVPLAVARLFTDLFTHLQDHVGDGVERALGRPPRAFEDYVTATAATGVWD
ncbi:NAD(P)H-binding protein [Actinomadura atramentaria]|uniref:NmrA family NAD(P)-binding protein n=1 Tax=Actinomadura atramentaria TaxID=1990 RepID=UPI000381F965|nr:NAD(P)H-binding protein [Actinomadura atramentaria]